MAVHVLGMKKNPNMLARQCINNRSHHSGPRHYLLGKLSNCSSTVVSGNKLMCCRDYTESDRNKFSQIAPATNSNTSAHTCALGLFCANTEVTEWAECYHHVLSSAPALYIFFLLRTLPSLLPPSSPFFWSRWRGGQAIGQFSFLHIHICQFDRVTYRERYIQLDNLSIIITVLLMLVPCLGDVMVWPDRARHNISRFALQILLMSVSFCQEYRKDLMSGFVFNFTFILYPQFQVQRWKTSCFSLQTC